MCMFKTKLWKKNVTKKFVGLRKLLSLAYYGQMYYRTAATALSNEAKSLSRCQPTLVSGNKDYKGWCKEKRSGGEVHPVLTDGRRRGSSGSKTKQNLKAIAFHRFFNGTETNPLLFIYSFLSSLASYDSTIKPKKGDLVRIRPSLPPIFIICMS